MQVLNREHVIAVVEMSAEPDMDVTKAVEISVMKEVEEVVLQAKGMQEVEAEEIVVQEAEAEEIVEVQADQAEDVRVEVVVDQVVETVRVVEPVAVEAENRNKYK